MASLPDPVLAPLAPWRYAEVAKEYNSLKRVDFGFDVFGRQSHYAGQCVANGYLLPMVLVDACVRTAYTSDPMAIAAAPPSPGG